MHRVGVMSRISSLVARKNKPITRIKRGRASPKLTSIQRITFRLRGISNHQNRVYFRAEHVIVPTDKTYAAWRKPRAMT
jgi:hypothetical protein